jgi:hypothetical protein
MEWWLSSTVWNITLSAISVSIVIGWTICGLFCSRSNRLTFYAEHQTSPWHIWPPVQWMLLILSQCWSSWCLRLITYLYFLLRLQISAAVTVLLLNVFMLYTGTALPFTILLEEWLQYLRGRNSVPHNMRAVWSDGTVSSYSTVLCQNTECCYLMISIKHGSLETSVHDGFPSV